jgi:Uri superfamily endonuclease
VYIAVNPGSLILNELTGEVFAYVFSTAHNYWVRINRLYDWLQWHVDYPHVYNPVLMAAVDGGSSSQIWEQKLRKWRKARARYYQND